mgnify:CR=1 FL=1
MQVLSKSSLPLGGFAGLREHRLVTDSRVFEGRKSPSTYEGLGCFVYLADAQFNPKGETGMHPHHEIDVISVMVDGEVSHAGSLEHGKSLHAGEVQVQRAGGEGFSHNEVNPNDSKNRMIQLWALPEQSGQPAGYKHYVPAKNGVTRIYGGSIEQSETFDSQTVIDIVNLKSGEQFDIPKRALTYLTKGEAIFKEAHEQQPVKDGDLIKSHNAKMTAIADSSFILIYQQ